jgi:hypothetical protein
MGKARTSPKRASIPPSLLHPGPATALASKGRLMLMRCTLGAASYAWRVRQLRSLIGFSHKSQAIFQFFVEKATV